MAAKKNELVDISTLLEKVLREGKDIERLLDDPVALAEMAGIHLSKQEKAHLSGAPVSEMLDQLYSQLGMTDKRFLMAKQNGQAAIPVTMVIPVVGVVVAVSVAAVVIKAGEPKKVADRSPAAQRKL